MIASDDPCTSDLIIKFHSSAELSEKAESWVANVSGFLISLFSCALFSLKVFASFSLSTTIKSSPDFAAPLIPKISTGADGGASLIFLFFHFLLIFLLPYLV